MKRAIVLIQILSRITLAVQAHVYSVSGTSILRNGIPWVPVGINALSLYGPAAGRVYPANLSLVREYVTMNPQEFYCHSGGCWGKLLSDGSYIHPLKPLLDRNVDEGYVTIVDLHKWDENTELWAKVPSQTAFFTKYIDKLVNEYVPFLQSYSEVWLSIWNEPFAWDGKDNIGPEQWSSEMTTIVQAVRNAGYTNVIVVPAGQMGQDETVLLGGYAKSLADTFGPIVFDVHCYNRWHRSTAEQIATRLFSLKSEGLSIIIGETGPSNAGQVSDFGPLLQASVKAEIGVLAWVWKCRRDVNDKNALRAPTSNWCQTWVYNDEGNFNWGSRFSACLSSNNRIVPNARQYFGGSLSYSYSSRNQNS